MRFVVVCTLFLFSNLPFSFADEPFGYIGVEIQNPEDKTRKPSQLRIPVYRFDEEGGGILHSLDSDTVISANGAFRLNLSPLPDNKGLDVKRTHANRRVHMNDGSSPNGGMTGFFIDGEYVTFDEKSRFPFPFEFPEPEGVIHSLSLDRESLIIIDNNTKKMEAFANGGKKIGTAMFPNQKWNALEVGPLGKDLWIVAFTDGPFSEPPFQPSLNNFQPPPRQERSHFAYIVDLKGPKTRALVGWRSVSSYSNIASLKNGSMFIITDTKDLPDYKGIIQSETTETSIWVDENGKDSPAQKRKKKDVDHWSPTLVTDNSVIRTSTDDSKRCKVEWIENGVIVKTDTLPFGEDSNRYQNLFFKQGVYFKPISPLDREVGPDVLTGASPARSAPPDYMQPIRFSVARREGNPIIVKIHHLEMQDALTNPRFYTILPSREYLWFMSAGHRHEKKTYVGYLPIKSILSAARYE